MVCLYQQKTSILMLSVFFLNELQSMTIKLWHMPDEFMGHKSNAAWCQTSPADWSFKLTDWATAAVVCHTGTNPQQDVANWNCWWYIQHSSRWFKKTNSRLWCGGGVTVSSLTFLLQYTVGDRAAISVPAAAAAAAAVYRSCADSRWRSMHLSFPCRQKNNLIGHLSSLHSLLHRLF